MVGEDANG